MCPCTAFIRVVSTAKSAGKLHPENRQPGAPCKPLSARTLPSCSSSFAFVSYSPPEDLWESAHGTTVIGFIWKYFAPRPASHNVLLRLCKLSAVSRLPSQVFLDAPLKELHPLAEIQMILLVPESDKNRTQVSRYIGLSPNGNSFKGSFASNVCVVHPTWNSLGYLLQPLGEW